MRSLRIDVYGKFDKTFEFLKNAKRFTGKRILEKYAKQGVDALMQNTPKDTGITASSWYYEIKTTKSGALIRFGNSNAPRGVNVAILLQYGHATRGGGWVKGVDYINPSLQPIFDKIAQDAWKEVSGK